ncbi:MAG: MATE family efflux transporter [Desulfovibrio sp.]|nr:MATE family efflux transporter [Desulfovibrio sp.]
MLMMYLFFFTGIVTVWVAGQISGDAQAALGLVTQCTIFLMVVIMSISSGATAAISQSLGMGKIARARFYIVSTVIGALGLGILMAIPALIFENSILVLIKTPEEIMPIARKILRVAILGLPFQYVYSCSGVMFRATRLVLPPLWVSAIICVLNYFFALGFGLGKFGFPNYGYMGLIWTNVACSALGGVLNCVLLVSSGYLRFDRLPSVKWLKGAMPYLIKVAMPAGAAQIVWQSGYLTLFVLVASLPRDNVAALAGLTAGLRAEALIFMPGMAFNMTASILVGNSLGEGKPERARRIGLRLTAVSVLIMSVVALLIWPFREEIARFLSQEASTREQIVSYLSYNLVSTPFTIASQVMGGIMVGAGATIFNLAIYGGAFWCVRLPLGWLLGHVLWQSSSGVFAAMVASQVIQTLIMLYVVLRANWQKYAMPSSRTKRR